MPWAKIQDRFSSQRVQESSTHRSTTRQPKRGGVQPVVVVVVVAKQLGNRVKEGKSKEVDGRCRRSWSCFTTQAKSRSRATKLMPPELHM